MYESVGYHALSLQVQHWDLVKRYVDMARTFRSMGHGGALTLETQPRHQTIGAHVIALGADDSLRKDLLNYMAERCEVIAAKMSESPPGPADIKDACKV